MKKTRFIMGMPITIEIVDSFVKSGDIKDIFDYFRSIDKKFSPFRTASEVSKINANLIKKQNYSLDMKNVLRLSLKTKKETQGYFDVYHKGKLDPSGIVKGMAIFRASKILRKKGFKNFFINAGGDIQVFGKNSKRKPWTVGIR